MTHWQTLFIDGQWREPKSDSVIEVLCPSTEEVIATVPDSVDPDVNEAVEAPRRAFDRGPWRRATVTERVRTLKAALQLLEPRTGEIAELVTRQIGLPISTCSQMIPNAFTTARFFLDVAESEPLVDLREGQSYAAVVREPVGVVALFPPWNGSFNAGLSRTFAALVTGCSVVFKPSPEAPLDIHLVAESLADAGLPTGVFNIVTGSTETGRRLVAHPDVNMVSFTGSTVAGQQIGPAAGH